MDKSIEIVLVNQVTPALEEAIQHLMPQLSINPPPSPAQLKEIVSAPNNSFFIAQTTSMPKQIMGMLTLVIYRVPTGAHGLIEDVVVDETWRGQGIGEALVTTALQRAARQGARSVDLTSRPSREAANRLYQRMGFSLRETNLYRYIF